MSEYRGITHAVPILILPLWKKLLCRHDVHAFDEVHSTGPDHYLSCDACGLIVNIASIDTRYIEDGGE